MCCKMINKRLIRSLESAFCFEGHRQKGLGDRMVVAIITAWKFVWLRKVSFCKTDVFDVVANLSGSNSEEMKINMDNRHKR